MSKNYFMPETELSQEQKDRIAEQYKKQQEEQAERSRKNTEDRINKKLSVDFMNVVFDPYEDRVLVYPDPVEEKTAGGLYKPEEAVNKVKPLIGTVVKVGPGKESINANAIVKALGYAADNAAGLKKEGHVNKYDVAPPKWSGEDFEALLKSGSLQDKLKPGDRIVYGNYAGTEFVLNDIKYLIMRYTDIFGRA